MNWFYGYLGVLGAVVGILVSFGIWGFAAGVFCHMLTCICAKLDVSQLKHFGGAE